MVSEGAQTSVHYYNQEVEDDVKMTSETDGLYHKKEKNDPSSEQTYQIKLKDSTIQKALPTMGAFFYDH